MNRNTLTALRKSIKHWEENLSAARPQDASTGSLACALCEQFLGKVSDKFPYGCAGCPVAERIGKPVCAMTPWRVAYNTWSAWKRGRGRGVAFRNACRAEIKFLKSLLPKESDQ